MKKNATLFLQGIVVLIGIATFVFMLWEPHLEGRNVNATLFEIYFKDPFLAYAYVSSIAFFAVLYQIFKVLGYAGQSKFTSPAVMKSLRMIKFCAMALGTLILGAEVYLFTAVRGTDDIAGGVAMGLFLMILLGIIAATAARFERRVQIALN